MRKTSFSKVILALASAGLFVAAPAHADKTLKMAYALSTSSHYGAGGEAFSKSIEAAPAATSRSSNSRTARWAASAK